MKEIDPSKVLMRPRKVADTLNVAPSTIYYWIATGRLEAVKLPGKTLRIRKSVVDDAQKDTLD
jgi:excisionase family DNA binding protein